MTLPAAAAATTTGRWISHSSAQHNLGLLRAIGGIRWVRQATTAVTEYPDPDAPGEPITVEAAAFDFHEVVGPAVLVQRHRVHFLVGGPQLAFDLDGARNLIAALTELVEAVEEGTR